MNYNMKVNSRDLLQVNDSHHLNNARGTSFLLAGDRFMTAQERQDDGTQLRMGGGIFAHTPHATAHIDHSQLSGTP